jgi:hypothetical protein
MIVSLITNKIPHAIHVMGFLKHMGILAWLILWGFFAYLHIALKKSIGATPSGVC